MLHFTGMHVIFLHHVVTITNNYSFIQQKDIFESVVFPSSIRQVLSIKFLKYTQVHTMSQVQVQVL